MLENHIYLATVN